VNRDSRYLNGNQYSKGNKPNRTSFVKGHIPWNKGMRGIHLSLETEFKKGGKPPTWCHVGTIRKRKHHRDKLPRYWIKIAEPHKWMLLSHYRWIQRYTFLIKGDIIHHRNGHSFDDRIDNLIALPREGKGIYFFLNIMILQRSKWERLGIHRSHLNGIRRWLASKGGRERFESKRDKELMRLKPLTRRNCEQK